MYIKIIFLSFVLPLVTLQAHGQSLYQYFENPAAGNPILICGHRGGYYPSLPENSPAIFEYIHSKADNKAQMFEIDIRESKDGILILAHDAVADRTMNLKDSIHHYTFDELQNGRLKDQNGNVTQYSISSFDEVLTWAKSRNVYLMLDVKCHVWEKLGKAVMSSGWADRCLVLTFNKENYLLAKTHLPYSFISVLVTNENQKDFFNQAKKDFNSMAAYVTTDTPDFIIDELKSKQIPLVADVREIHQGIFQIPDKQHYIHFISKTRPDILVTDFPVEVGHMLSK
jgi:glycerophosphoryl diester phosphodiesterase